jgi:uncharacterized membrane protein (DUF106 family)
METPGSEKSDLKKQIRTLKAEIVEAIRAKDRVKLKKLRRHVRGLKSQTRKLASAKAPSTVPEPVTPPSAA